MEKQRLRIKDLEPGELLFVYRRRSTYTQQETADIFGVSINQYRAWETGTDQASRHTVRELKKISEVRSPNDGTGLQQHEIATLLRRRWKIRQPTLADELGVSTNWLCRMEKGDVRMNQKLLEYWNLA